MAWRVYVNTGRCIAIACIPYVDTGHLVGSAPFSPRAPATPFPACSLHRPACQYRTSPDSVCQYRASHSPRVGQYRTRMSVPDIA
eukprot:2887253-Rhodomonas_salina.1